MLHLKKFEDIAEGDLLALVSNSVREGQHIDFKRDINLAPPKAKPEMLRDVSSFANASGGDIVVGMEEVDGVASKLSGLAAIDFEQLEQQIQQICRAHIDPPVNGIRFRVIRIASGAEAFVIRIPKTWNGPHMVMMDGENRCWVRDQSGKRMMDIPDLKQALAFSEGAAERMKRFRSERVGQVISRETPIPLFSNRCVVLHLLPLVSFTSSSQIDAAMLANVEMPPMRHNNGWSPTHTFEGKMAYSSFQQGPAYTYMLLFRNGVVEAVESHALEPKTDGNLKGFKCFFSFHFGMLIDGLETALKMYRKLGVPTPIFGAVSLTGVKDYAMYIPPQYSGATRSWPLSRDTLVLPEFLIENLDSDAKSLLKPSFDIWWQACGFTSMPAWVEKV